MSASAGVVAFAFGTPSTISSNQRIAEIASKNARDLGGRIYTQRDVQVKNGIPVDYIEEEVGNPPPTLRIAREAVAWAAHLGYAELWVVAAKPHLWRALRDVEKAVREIEAQIEICVCPEIKIYREDSWFCVHSTQDRVRSREAWNKRERILKIMPFFIYRLVAS